MRNLRCHTSYSVGPGQLLQRGLASFYCLHLCVRVVPSGQMPRSPAQPGASAVPHSAPAHSMTVIVRQDSLDGSGAQRVRPCGLLLLHQSASSRLSSRRGSLRPRSPLCLRWCRHRTTLHSRLSPRLGTYQVNFHHRSRVESVVFGSSGLPCPAARQQLSSERIVQRADAHRAMDPVRVRAEAATH